ncbi:hypothetical protein RclHR1_12730009 [Rhizophagus clarus]|uniref:Uncharacterized protein n=1 Tax=Rhizophagus clarus TaxID=94130 RepID=A0A2Z6QCU5_9GLOM|nr:hypothetical protein RclHR1_12730009 [Rhizophagus clarus]
MNNNPLQKYYKLTFTESNNIRQSTATVIQPEQDFFVNYNSTLNANSSVTNDNIFSTFYTNNYSSQQHISSDNITSSSTAPPNASQYVNPQQPSENAPPPLGLFNMTNINPSQSEILSFDIPGFKIIIIPTFSQRDNTYGTQFTQFQQ